MIRYCCGHTDVILLDLVADLVVIRGGGCCLPGGISSCLDAGEAGKSLWRQPAGTIHTETETLLQWKTGANHI